MARDRVGIGFVVVKGGLEATCRLGCTKLDWLLCEARSGLVLLDLLGFPTPFSHPTVRRVTDLNWVSLLSTHKQKKNGDVSGGNGFPNDHRRFFNNLALLDFFFFFFF